jgi:hypothetical protein
VEKRTSLFGLLVSDEGKTSFTTLTTEREGDQRGAEGKEARGQEELHDPQEKPFG